MTDEEMAEEYCNHLQSEMLAYTPENPRQQRTVTLLDIEDAFLAGLKGESEVTKQLTQAKEIIKDLLKLPFANNEEVYADVTSHLDRAEQFLSEVEK